MEETKGEKGNKVNGKNENKYELDTLLMNELRFFIMTILSMYENADFQFLKSELGASDGNLSVQLKKLEEADYIRSHKEFVGKKSHTTYKILPLGLKRLKEYLKRMKKISDTIDRQ